MAGYTKYENGIAVLVTTANVATDTFKVALTNAAPNTATHSQLADTTEIAAGNGYSAGGATLAVTSVEAGGTYTVTQDATVTFTAAGGAIGPFRYAVFYDDTVAGDPVLSYFDYGSSITLQDGETLDLTAGANLFTVG